MFLPARLRASRVYLPQISLSLKIRSFFGAWDKKPTPSRPRSFLATRRVTCCPLPSTLCRQSQSRDGRRKKGKASPWARGGGGESFPRDCSRRGAINGGKKKVVRDSSNVPSNTKQFRSSPIYSSKAVLPSRLPPEKRGTGHERRRSLIIACLFPPP